MNRTAFYTWKNAPQTVFEEQDDELAPLIRVIFKKHRRRYGTRRIIKDLKELGHVCSRRKAASIMKTLHLKAIQPKSFVPKTTDSRHRLGYSSNLLLEVDSPRGSIRSGLATSPTSLLKTARSAIWQS